MAVAGGTQILMGLLSTHGFFLTWRTGLKIRVALINLIYRKSLYMAPNKSRDSGAITNLINTDAQLMSETIGFVVIAFLAPFQIAGCVILLARQLGNYAMIPVAAFVFAVPFGGIFGRRLGNLRLKIQAITDMRVRKIKEFITANRIVKYYAWENPIAASVAAVRLAELAVLKTMTYETPQLFSFRQKLTIFLFFIPLMFTPYQVDGERHDVCIAEYATNWNRLDLFLLRPQ